MAKKFPLIVIAILALFTGGIYLLHQQYPAYDFSALLIGNVLMAGLTLVAFAIARRNIGKPPQAFVRGVMSAMMLKMFICIAAALAYAFTHKDRLYKPTMIVFFVFYAVYTAVETVLLQRMAKVSK